MEISPALCVSEVASMSTRRLALLTSSASSGVSWSGQDVGTSCSRVVGEDLGARPGAVVAAERVAVTDDEDVLARTHLASSSRT